MFDGERLTVNLETMAPGLEVAVALDGIDRDELSGHDRVLVLQARARQVAHYQAAFYADVQSVWDAEREVCDETMADLRAEGLSWSSEIDEM
ncbi:MAG TPA: hypothetical protein VI193_08965, partial [Acidimicrobiia bacterium]